MAILKSVLLSTLGFGGAFSTSSYSATILYTQNFENPVGFTVIGYYDVSSQQVNDLYANQPVGFAFAQQFTVETISLKGGTAFGTGYTDSSGQGGNYSIAMLSTVQPDLLSLSFDVGAFDFLNFQLDVSRLGLDEINGSGGPFANGAPSFRFSLFDNPTGALGLSGNGTLLSTFDASGVDSVDNKTLNWTTLIAPLDAKNSTNGKVTLQIDLLSGGYATLDNFIIAASNVAGDVTPPTNSVPDAGGTLALLSLGLAGTVLMARRVRRVF